MRASDLREKIVQIYQQSNTFVLILPDGMSVECFRRNDVGHWVLYPYEKEEVHLASVDFRCAIAEIYEDVILLDENIS